MTSKQLPEWGRGQYELVADPFTFHENALWVADEVVTYTSVRVSKDNYTVTDVSVLSIIVKIYQIHVSVTLYLQVYYVVDLVLYYVLNLNIVSPYTELHSNMGHRPLKYKLSFF